MRNRARLLAKDVTAKCFCGDVTRKRKMLEKQNNGKKRMHLYSKMDMPQQAFDRGAEGGYVARRERGRIQWQLLHSRSIAIPAIHYWQQADSTTQRRIRAFFGTEPPRDR